MLLGRIKSLFPFLAMPLWKENKNFVFYFAFPSLNRNFAGKWKTDTIYKNHL
jgi:hypothetical protein